MLDETFTLLFRRLAFAKARESLESLTAVIEDGSVSVAVSAVTAFEIRTKAALGKLTFDGDIAIHLEREGFDELPVSIAHAVAAGSLPLIHRDPFDRLLIGQAHCERLTVATRDAVFQHYGIPVLAA